MDQIYTYTIPVFIKMLNGLVAVLEKSKQHVIETGSDEAAFLQDRLAPDMFPFVKQVQVATDQAKGLVKRLTDIETPAYEDTEDSFDALITRVKNTIAFLESVPESALSDAAACQITMPYFPDMYMDGFGYAREYVIPNSSSM